MILNTCLQKFFTHFKMSFLTLFHSLKGAEKAVDNIEGFIVAARRFHLLTRQWLENFIMQINSG